MLKALSGAGPFAQLDCIEDMRVTIPETKHTTENAAVLVAFSALATACRHVQVCGMLLALPSARSMSETNFQAFYE